MKRASDEQLRKVTIGKPQQVNGSITIVEYDPAWPVLFEKEAVRIRSALGDRVLSIEHVGSTSVRGLAAKPKIDILLVVADTADEAACVPALEAAYADAKTVIVEDILKRARARE